MVRVRVGTAYGAFGSVLLVVTPAVKCVSGRDQGCVGENYLRGERREVQSR